MRLANTMFPCLSPASDHCTSHLYAKELHAPASSSSRQIPHLCALLFSGSQMPHPSPLLSTQLTSEILPTLKSCLKCHLTGSFSMSPAPPHIAPSYSMQELNQGSKPRPWLPIQGFSHLMAMGRAVRAPQAGPSHRGRF